MKYSKQQWLDNFRGATQGSATAGAAASYQTAPAVPQATTSYSTAPAWSEWQWSEEHGRDYRYRQNPAEPNGYEYQYRTVSKHGLSGKGKGKG